MDTFEEKQEWLKSLEVGDKVCKFDDNRWYPNREYYKILTIKNITKGGNLRLDDGELIKLGYTPEIQPITQDIILHNKKMNIRRRLDNRLKVIDVFTLTMETVVKMLEVLNNDNIKDGEK